MAGERDVLLGDVSELVRGVSYRPADLLSYGAGAVPLLRATNIGNCVLDLSDVLYVSSASVRNPQYLRRFDVVIAMSSGSRKAVGRLAQLRQDWTGCVGAFCGVIRPNPQLVHPEYLGYVLQSADFRTRIETYAVGTAIMNLSRERILGFSLRLPDFDEQRAIAHILGTLDDKIELNRRMNETLQAMTRALFKSWFVDFAPVRAKAEGRASDLPKPLADLFPAHLVDSELGEIPEGWSVAPLSNCVDVMRGLSYKGSGLTKDGMPMHNLNSIYEGGGYKHDGLKHYEGKYKPQHIARAGDLIVANTEQGHHRLLIGYAAIVPTCSKGQSIFSHHIYRVRTKSSSGLTPDYLCHLLNTNIMHDTVSGYANGTTVNMLPVDSLQTPKILVPPARVVASFNDIAEAARKRLEEMVEETHSLAALRDTLLPKLISGELKIASLEERGLETAI